MEIEEAKAKRDVRVSRYCVLMDERDRMAHAFNVLDGQVLRAKVKAEAAQNIVDCLVISDVERRHDGRDTQRAEINRQGHRE